MRRSVKYLAYGLGGLTGLVLLAFAAVQTGPVTRQIEQIAENAVPGLDLEGLDIGLSSSTIRVANVTMADQAGIWLDVKNAKVDWQWSPLTDRALILNVIRAGRFAILRAPISDPTIPPPAPAPEESLALPTTVTLPLSVDLQSLEITEIFVGQALATQDVLATLKANAAVSRDGEASLKFDLARSDGVGGFVKIAADMKPSDRSLALDVDAFEPAGGVVSGLLQVPGDQEAALRLQGSGTLDRWEGLLTASLGPDIGAEFDLLLGGPDPLSGKITGQARPGPLVPQDLAPYVGKAVSLDLVASRRADGAIAVERLAVSATAGSLDAKGTMTADQSIDLSAKIQTAPTLILPEPFTLGEGRLEVTATGPLLSPRLVASLSVVDPALGDRKLDPILSGQTTLDVVMRPDVTAQNVTIEELALASEIAQIYGDGAVSLAGEAGPTGSAVLNLDLPDLSRLADLTGHPLSGAASGTVVAELSETAFLIADIYTDRLTTGQEAVDRLHGGALTLSLSAEAPLTAERIQIDALSLDAGVATLDASGGLEPNGDGSGIDFRLNLPRLNAFAGLAKETSLGGNAVLTGRVTGTLSDPFVSAELASSMVQAAGYSARNTTLTARVQNAFSAPAGFIELKTDSSIGSLDLSSNFALVGQDASVSELRLVHAGTSTLSADLATNLESLNTRGQLHLNAPDLETFSGIAGQKLAGAIDLALGLSVVGQRQDADLKIKAHRLEAAGVRVGNADIEGKAKDLLEDPMRDIGLDVLVTATDVATEGLTLDDTRLTAQGSLPALALTLSTRGLSTRGLSTRGGGGVDPPAKEAVAADISTTLDLSNSDQGAVSGTIEALAARYEKITAQLDAPATFAYGPERIAADIPSFSALGARLAAQIELADQVAGTLDLSGVDFANLTPVLGDDAPVLEGKLTLAATLEGNAENPTLALDVTSQGIGLNDPDSGALPTLDANVTARLQNGSADLMARISGFAEAPLTANAALPVSLNLKTFEAVIDQTAQLTAAIDWQGDLAELVRYAPVAGLGAKGAMTLDLSATGSVAEPALSGGLTLRDGELSSTLAGLTLTPVTLDIKGNGRSITLALDATTPQNGRLKADGAVAFETLADPLIDLKITADRAMLAQREDVTAITNADITLDGRPSAMAVTGTIAPQEIEVRLVDALPPSVVTIDVISTEELAAKQDEPESVPGGEIALDLNIPLDGKVFVRGRGLDSEWGGGFQITGTAAKPVIAGQIAPIRGSLSFAGRAFDITESVIRFEQGNADPTLGIKASTEADGITAIVAVEGTPSEPEILFSSQPELPRDEVLARILFGKSTANLTQGEALQLAQAVATASSGEAGFTDVARDALGLDQLSFGDAEGEGGIGTVRAGRYVAEDVFVGVEQGASASSSKVKVEVDLTNRIKVETEVSANSESRVGVTYEFEY